MAAMASAAKKQAGPQAAVGISEERALEAFRDSCWRLNNLYWIAKQLGRLPWMDIGREIALRTEREGSRIILDDLEIIAASTAASPEDVQTALTSLTSGHRSLLRQFFYSLDRPGFEIPSEEVGNPMALRSESPDQ